MWICKEFTQTLNFLLFIPNLFIPKFYFNISAFDPKGPHQATDVKSQEQTTFFGFILMGDTCNN